jgi:hypothetical protein
MRVDFDPEVKAWYVAIADRPVARTAHVSDDHAVVAELGRRFPAVREALADLRGLAVAG